MPTGCLDILLFREFLGYGANPIRNNQGFFNDICTRTLPLCEKRKWKNILLRMVFFQVAPDQVRLQGTMIELVDGLVDPVRLLDDALSLLRFE